MTHKRATPEQVERWNAARRAKYQANPEPLKARARAWYQANLEKARAMGRDYARLHRQEARARYETWIADPENRKRVNVLSRRWARDNRTLRNAAWHRYRARMLGQFVEDVDRTEVLHRAGGLCGWCSQPVDPAWFHIDHIVALVHGGEHSYANTQPVHPACNYEKRTVLKERAA